MQCNHSIWSSNVTVFVFDQFFEKQGFDQSFNLYEECYCVFVFDHGVCVCMLLALCYGLAIGFLHLVFDQVTAFVIIDSDKWKF